jgi:hypothetical protein
MQTTSTNIINNKSELVKVDGLRLRDAIITNAIEEDGFTLNAVGEKVRTPYGYAVGVKGFDNPDDLAEFVSRNPIYFAGFWRDENGKPFYDAVRIEGNLQFAIALGRAHEQRSIYNFENGETIYINSEVTA